jgi:hypothetical protein
MAHLSPNLRGFSFSPWNRVEVGTQGAAIALREGVVSRGVTTVVVRSADQEFLLSSV